MLTDREKSIIGVIYLSLSKDIENKLKPFLMEEYSLIFKIDSTSLTFALKDEIIQYRNMINDISRNIDATFDNSKSYLNYREKYIFYNMFLMFEERISRDLCNRLKELIRVLIYRKDDSDLLNAIAEQINQTQLFYRYVSKL